MIYVKVQLKVQVCSKEVQKVYLCLDLRSFCVLVPAVKLCDGPASLHLQEVLHAGLWSGATVHQHQRRSPTGKKGNVSMATCFI